MAKCKICGKAVVTAHVFHRECWQEEVEKLAQVFCDNYCRWPRECPNQDELEDKHCDSCDLIREDRRIDYGPSSAEGRDWEPALSGMRL